MVKSTWEDSTEWGREGGPVAVEDGTECKREWGPGHSSREHSGSGQSGGHGKAGQWWREWGVKNSGGGIKVQRAECQRSWDCREKWQKLQRCRAAKQMEWLQGRDKGAR